MRMEELSDSQYIKGTDTVERYLLGLVRAYFADSNVAEPASREFIIRRAVLRMKEEFRYENIGVLSVTLADGIARTGPVSITLADLGAEPAITPKLSAFNVNFGDQANTACEGNDPRLEDSRDPNPHTHNIQDINGLEGRLSTLMSAISRVATAGHVHQNYNVLDKIVYSGSRSTIDLNFIDTLGPNIDQKINDIRDRINTVISVDVKKEVDKVDAALKTAETKLSQAQQTTGVIHQNYLTQSKAYTDTKASDVMTQLQGTLNGYVEKSQLTNTVAGALSFAGSMLMSCRLMQDKGDGIFMYEIDIIQSIIDELDTRQANFSDCLVDVLVKNNNEYTKTPYLYIDDDGGILGILTSSIDYANKKINLVYKGGNITTLPSVIANSTIEIKVYSKRSVDT